MASEESVNAWNDYKNDVTNRFLEKQGGIVGIMMDDAKHMFYQLIEKASLVDYFIQEEYCDVDYGRRTVQELFVDKHIKISIDDKIFTVSKIQYLKKDGREHKITHYKYCYNGKRKSIYSCKFEGIVPILGIEKHSSKLGKQLHRFFFEDFDKLFNQITQNQEGSKDAKLT